MVHGQTFQQRLIGHDVSDDLHVRVLLFVARENIFQNFAAVAVISAGEAHFLSRLCGACKGRRANGERQCHAVFTDHLFSSLR